MKNAINYYYQLYPDNVHQKDKKFTFTINNIKYIFIQFQKDITKLSNIQNISTLLINKNITHNQIIKNMSNSYITYINNIPYVLLKINVDDDNLIIFEDIIYFNKITNNTINEFMDIKILKKIWMDKIDYFEYQVSQFGIKFPKIRMSFNYFIGLAENAIILLNDILSVNIKKTICHYRIPINMKLKDLYNPIEFVLDSRIRDICEFLKLRIFVNDNTDLVTYYFSYNYITNDEAILFLARLLYPTYYFDICEQIIDGYNDNYLIEILNKIETYEKNLKKIYYFLKQNYKIPDIEWLT